MLVVVIPVIVATLAFAWWYRSSNTRASRGTDESYEGRIEFVIWSIPALTVMLHWKEISDAIAPSLEARTKVAARPSRLKSKAGPAERHPGVLWKPQRFVQVRIVKNVPEMIDDLAISPKLIRKHKLDRSQHECEKCVVAVQQHGFYRRRTDEIA
jgi:hypothetical protein